MKAVILAGGYGKRLRPLTDQVPKSLIDLGGRPIIEWQVAWLKGFGISSFVVLAGHLREKLIEHLEANAERLGAEFAFSEEKEPLGSGGALKNAERLLAGEREFVAINGDVVTDIGIDRIRPGGNIASISLVPLRSPYGIVGTENGRVTKFEEKPVLKEYWINAGVYVMKSEIFKHLKPKGDMERTTFVELAGMGLLGCEQFPSSYWRSIDSVKDIEEVSADMRQSPIA